MSLMQIVIPGALPPIPVASELARLLPERAPILLGWLQAATAKQEGIDVRAQGCTPYEAWQLGHANFQPAQGMPVGAGLGPLLAGNMVKDSQPVWLAELSHLSLGADQATLLDPGQMEISAEEAQGLFEAALPSFDAAGFGATPLSPQRWRLTLPDGLHPPTASPATVVGQPLRHWWSQDTAMRPWRRLLNEIQMEWYEHPVNEARTARGLPPVNALWLYGGAPSWPEASNTAAVAQDDTILHIFTELDLAHRNEDWASWLDGLAYVDQHHLRPLSNAQGLPAQPAQLILLGAERRAILSLQPRNRLLSWLPAPKKNWNTWWSRPV